MKKILSKEEAISMLPEGDDIHTFMSSKAGIIIGAGWSRQEAIDDIEKYPCELAGPSACAMKHGLAIHRPSGPVFIECNMTRYAELDAQEQSKTEAAT